MDGKEKDLQFVDETEDFDETEVFEGSYTSDMEDDDPCSVFCDMPDEEKDDLHGVKKGKKAAGHGTV